MARVCGSAAQHVLRFSGPYIFPEGGQKRRAACWNLSYGVVAVTWQPNILLHHPQHSKTLHLVIVVVFVSFFPFHFFLIASFFIIISLPAMLLVQFWHNRHLWDVVGLADGMLDKLAGVVCGYYAVMKCASLLGYKFQRNFSITESCCLTLYLVPV